MESYKSDYQLSMEKPFAFWKQTVEQLVFKTEVKQDNFLSYNFDVKKGPVRIECMPGVLTNVSFNLLDRNVEKGLGNQTAFLWEGNDPEDSRRITYSALLDEVCQFANVLKRKGVQKGDKVLIYMPMVLETIIAMLGCTRIGAVHCVVFSGFAVAGLAERLEKCRCKVIVTSDVVRRGTKTLDSLSKCRKAMLKCEKDHKVSCCIVVRLSDNLSSDDLTFPMEFWWHEEMKQSPKVCEPEWVDAEHELFVLFTSGSTGIPKGLVHTTGGYLLHVTCTFQRVFDYAPGDVYWSTADIGWISGHSYGVYGPLANGAASVMIEGSPLYPNEKRIWEIIEKYKVNILYTAPTVIRNLMKFGEEQLKSFRLDSLKLLGSVGEPINPEAWKWYHANVGQGKCPIVDTYWQTEGGGHLITPIPHCTPLKPGSATFPFFGIEYAILDESGREIKEEGEGALVFKRAWPGMARTILNDHLRFQDVYFKKFPGYFFTGDGARRDAEGYVWITGRIDDMLNVSGHLLSTAEVEAVLANNIQVSEAAVVSTPHSIKSEVLYCFVVPNQCVENENTFAEALRIQVRVNIGAFASPDVIQVAEDLPKTFSGKIVRRILAKIARNDPNLGDTSTVVNPEVIEALIHKRDQLNGQNK